MYNHPPLGEPLAKYSSTNIHYPSSETRLLVGFSFSCWYKGWNALACKTVGKLSSSSAQFCHRRCSVKYERLAINLYIL